MALSSSGIFDKLANEILDQILQEVIAHNIQEYCVPPTECHPTQNWSSLTVLPRVCRRFRDISFHLFSLAFKMDFEGVNPGAPLKRITQHMNSLRKREVSLSTQLEVENLGECPSDLNGILRIYWEVIMMRSKAGTVLKTSWRDHENFNTKVQGLSAYLAKAYVESNKYNSGLKPRRLAYHAMDHLSRYRFVYHAACTFWLIRLWLQDVLDNERTASDLDSLLRRLVKQERSLEYAKQLEPEFIQVAMRVTEFVEMLERIRKDNTFRSVWPIVDDLNRRWAFFVLKSNRPMPLRQVKINMHPP